MARKLKSLRLWNKFSMSLDNRRRSKIEAQPFEDTQVRYKQDEGVNTAVIAIASLACTILCLIINMCRSERRGRAESAPPVPLVFQPAQPPRPRRHYTVVPLTASSLSIIRSCQLPPRPPTCSPPPPPPSPPTSPCANARRPEVSSERIGHALKHLRPSTLPSYPPPMHLTQITEALNILSGAVSPQASSLSTP